MRPLVGFQEARALDSSTSERYGLSPDSLMESAARGMADFILADGELREAMRRSSIPAAAVCGRGGNAGDALAVLRRLAFEGFQGAAVVAGPLAGIAARRLDEASRAGVAVYRPEEPAAARAAREAGLALDGIAGIGFEGDRRGQFEALASLLQGRRGPIVAIDVPSGVGAPRSFDRTPPQPVGATLTLCVAPAKRELYFPGWRSFAGRIAEIGGVFPKAPLDGAATVLLEAGDEDLPYPPPDAHKGERGALAAYAGSPGATGAAALCARAASAAGAGSVTVLARDELVHILSAKLDSQMVRPAGDPGARRYHAVLAGPGWGLSEGNAKILDGLWESESPLAVDADGLRLLAARPRKPRGGQTVLLPHPGEFAPLLAAASGCGSSEASVRAAYDTVAALKEVAAYYGAIVVLKGSVTWIGDPSGRASVWDGREPSLATAGSGDVLAGLAAGYLARGWGSQSAARAAVIVHGMAGRMAAKAGFYEAEALIPLAAALSAGRA